MMRRGFVASLIGSGMASLVAGDPERLLWVPGRKLISIPKPSPRLLAIFHSDNERFITSVTAADWDSIMAQAPDAGYIRRWVAYEVDKGVIHMRPNMPLIGANRLMSGVVRLAETKG